MRPCRLIIYVDDLDKCPPAKVAEVLEVLALITDKTPFIIILSVDPRIVATAMESSRESYGDEAIDGSELLNKIVQIPFSVPTIANSEMQKMCKVLCVLACLSF